MLLEYQKNSLKMPNCSIMEIEIKVHQMIVSSIIKISYLPNLNESSIVPNDMEFAFK